MLAALRFFKTLRLALVQFFEDEALTRAAALAFYSGLSLAPLLVLVIWLLGHVGPEWQQRVIDEVVALIGNEGGNAIRMVVENAEAHPDFGNLAGVVSLAMIAFSGTAVFAQLQNALNAVWGVRAKPGKKFFAFAKKRILSLGFVVSFAFLLLVSLVASAGVAAFVQTLDEQVGPLRHVLPALDFLVPVLVYTALFMAIYNWLPDISLSWRSVAFGGTCTAVLFAIGKAAIGFYLGTSTVGSAYGAAGSFVVLLVWVYYSAAIVLFGAEMTKANCILLGRHPNPTAWAEWDRRTESPFREEDR